jgi:ComF family protein
LIVVVGAMKYIADSDVWSGVGRLGKIVAGGVLDVLLPPRCIKCQARLANAGHLCGPCWQEMPLLCEPVCDRYGVPFSHDIGEGGLSARAITDPPLFGRARAASIYSGTARDLVLSLKFARRRDLAEPMGRWMAHGGRRLIGPESLLVPVPLHRLRLWERRFNQSADLARVVARTCKVRWNPMLLQRVRRTRQQVGLDSAERLKNVRGAFQLRKGCEGEVHDRRIVLVDDVLTTGSTATACTKVLLAAGAASVDVLTFAVATVSDGEL